jgi:hypothetical protein
MNKLTQLQDSFITYHTNGEHYSKNRLTNFQMSGFKITKECKDGETRYPSTSLVELNSSYPSRASFWLITVRFIHLVSLLGSLQTYNGEFVHVFWFVAPIMLGAIAMRLNIILLNSLAEWFMLG